ncbi:unnamed protein product [Lathyrus oleraceus]
MATKLKCE